MPNPKHDEACEVLCRMQGFGKTSAAAFLSDLEEEIVSSIAKARTGAELRAVLDQIASMENPEPETSSSISDTPAE